MEVIIVLAILIIAAATFIYVTFPLWGRKSTLAVSILREGTEENLQDLISEKESAYQALTELEFDMKAKKLSPEDYESLRREYEEVAISVLDKIDSVETGEKEKERSIEDELEEEIRKARGRGEEKK